MTMRRVTVDELENNFPVLTVQRLAPYYLLNPIEYIWCKMKSHVKRHMRVPAVTCPGVGETTATVCGAKTLTMQWRP